MKTLDPEDGRPLSMQVADVLRHAIRDGYFEPGAKLPSRATMANHFGVAPMTVQNAIRMLREEGLVVTRQGSGIYARSILPPEVDVPEKLVELERRIEALEQLLRKD